MFSICAIVLKELFFLHVQKYPSHRVVVLPKLIIIEVLIIDSNNTWYCHNDSSCKEVSVNNIDKSTAYILLYEREGLSTSGQ